MFGAVEAGGTKFVCAVGDSPDNIIAQTKLPTETPAKTIKQMVDFFQPYADQIRAYSVASFGPIDLHESSPTFGYITSTPKLGWQNIDLVGPLVKAFGKPISFDTDVNGAALGEYVWGAAQSLETFIYLTVGTGIGGGGMVSGNLIHGMLHPEMGHLRIAHDWNADPFAGICPFHGDCLEGMASGPAIEARWGQPAIDLAPNHEAWTLEANYLAEALVNFILTLSPERIILGGGVMNQRQLFPLIRRKVLDLLAGYVRVDRILDDIDSYIVPASYGGLVGVLGGFALAQRSLEEMGK